MIIVSSCLVGCKCRYNGSNYCIDWVESILNKGLAVPVCPEQLGGLSTPRPPAELVYTQNGYRVLTKSGEDVTTMFHLGAQRTLSMAKILDTKVAILKSNSPSCGFSHVYSGDFDGTLIKGKGVTANLLFKHGIRIFTEEQENECLRHLSK